MSSRLAAFLLRDKLTERGLVRQLPTFQQLKASGPWKGYTPDLDHHLLDFTYFRDVVGLVARPGPTVSLGEVLTHDDGWDRIDAARLPLGTDAAGAAGTANTVVVGLPQFPRTNATGATTGEFNITPMALVAGDNTTANTFSLWRISPGTGQWTRIVISAAGTAAVHGPLAPRDGDTGTFASMPDFCVFPRGAPARAAYSGAIDQPCMVITNNRDRVMVFPAGAAGGADAHTFESLTDQFGGNFYAVSCETWDSRVVFLNTSENGTRFRNRLRRTAQFTADPLVTAMVGSGFIDMNEFAGDGVRAESLGDNLACYFEDGVAIVRKTSVPTAPHAYDVLNERRGLLGTHALVDLGDNRHFGVFTDGWWFLDSNGRWEEAGTAVVNNIEVELWKKDFYERLNFDQRQRIQISYDQPKNWIRISFPTVGDSDMSEVWIYDVNGNRVWRDRYQATCWGEYSRQITTALLWSTATQQWSTIVGSWASLDAQFSLTALVHGDVNGLVFGHDPDLITRDGLEPTFSLAVMPNDMGEPNLLKCTDRLSVEYIDVGNANPQSMQLTNGELTEGGARAFQVGSPGVVRPARQNGRVSGEHLSFIVSGTGPVMMRSFVLDYTIDNTERRV